MSELNDALSRWEGDQPKSGDIGAESSWLSLSSLYIASGKLWAGDGQMLGYEQQGQVVDLPPGPYEVSACVMSYGSDRRVSRFRCLREGADGQRGSELGESWADTGYYAFADNEEWRAIGERDTGEEIFAQLEGFLLLGDERCGEIVYAPDGVRAVWVPAGFGDGTFHVHELVNGRGRVGVEVVFVQPDEPYPF